LYNRYTSADWSSDSSLGFPSSSSCIIFPHRDYSGNLGPIRPLRSTTTTRRAHYCVLKHQCHCAATHMAAALPCPTLCVVPVLPCISSPHPSSATLCLTTTHQCHLPPFSCPPPRRHDSTEVQLGVGSLARLEHRPTHHRHHKHDLPVPAFRHRSSLTGPPVTLVPEAEHAEVEPELHNEHGGCTGSGTTSTRGKKGACRQAGEERSGATRGGVAARRSGERKEEATA
jgi:hypothetical protein